jgi:tetratricopeptide (TPR) repeat protein
VVHAQLKEGNLEEWNTRLEEAQRTFDDSALDRLITAITPTADSSLADFETQLLLSKVYLVRCDLRRFKRKTYEISKAENKSLREQQEELAKRGMVYAERAIALRPNSSEAHRVTGELWIHQITGPLTGFRFGPNGKDSIEKAIQLDPKNLEARRALGLMYLYNPPFNGGDKEKAAKTFDELSEAGGGDRCYVLAARAYLEKNDINAARSRLKRALELNPENVEAKKLLQDSEK